MSQAAWRRIGVGFLGSLIVLTTLTLYSPVRHHGFVNIDDEVYVTKNPRVAGGPTLDNIAWALTSSHSSNWHPVTWISHMLDCRVFGMNPGPHHVVSVLLHAANSFLLLVVLSRMTGQLWPSAFVAAVFALHPLHVESVAWIAERKDVLSTLFWLATTWTWVSYVERGGPARYGTALLLFGLGLMTKPMLVTLPFVLLLLDYWPLGRLGAARWTSRDPWRLSHAPGYPKAGFTLPQLVLEKLPFFALAALSSLVTFLVQREGGSVAPLDRLPLDVRLANALVSYATYLLKTVWPTGLAVFYPFDERLAVVPVAASGLLVLGGTAFALWKSQEAPPAAVGWLWYVGTLVPVIGLVQVGNQARADRYTYVPMVGLAILAAWGAPVLLRRWRFGASALGVLAPAILGACVLLSWEQIGTWKNSRALYERALAVTQRNRVAHYNLALHFAREEDLDQAVAHYSEALRIQPRWVEAHYNLANALSRQGKLDEAIAHYAEALRIAPGDAEAHMNLGIALSRQGRLEEAAAQCLEALRLKSDYAEAHNNLASILARRGDTNGALLHYREALRIRPDYALARTNLEQLLSRQRRAGPLPTPDRASPESVPGRREAP